ncbi:hypothetical protein [Pseudoalteromonas shioyasakiensis]|uniref:hypothetical protein n=1 Tax=Pseudoalteromonas shioyasakiensis TaxID=1190813 RepID=UPI0022B158E0|nr:hypothetical protein [Pseudoalteromonas shioyasakiensis]MCZ4253765.1 hypothetical protein [Pseudoalteromonas shioyasakiensis]
MKIDNSNTVYVFRDNEKMDCPENLIAYVHLDDTADLSKWFEDTLKEIKGKYFVQFLFENGSFIRAHSAKQGFVKYIRFWLFKYANEFSGGVNLVFLYCNKRGLGNKSILIEEFIDLLFNDEIKQGDVASVFQPKGCSKHPSYPKEPNVISDSRVTMNKAIQLKLIDKIPDFCLEHLKIRPYELTTNPNKELYHLISNKQNLLSYFEELFANSSIIDNLEFRGIDIAFRNAKNEKLKGESVYCRVNISNYEGFTAECYLDIYSKNFQLSAEAKVYSLEELVEMIFLIPRCDKQGLQKSFKIISVMSKEPKVSNKSKQQGVKSFSQTEIDKLKKAIDLNQSQIIRFEDEEHWLEIAPISDSQWGINFYYPSVENPLDFLKKSNINIPKTFELNFWEANLACTFSFEPTETNTLHLVQFTAEILINTQSVVELSSVEISFEEL